MEPTKVTNEPPAVVTPAVGSTWVMTGAAYLMDRAGLLWPDTTMERVTVPTPAEGIKISEEKAKAKAGAKTEKEK